MTKEKPIAEIILIGWKSPEEWEEYFIQKHLKPIEDQFRINSGTKFQINICRIVKLVGFNPIPYIMKLNLTKCFIESAVKKPLN